MGKKESTLKVDLIKKMITSNPLITNEWIARQYDLNADYVRQWFNTLSEDWLFIQTNKGQKHYCTVDYAQQNNTPLEIVAQRSNNLAEDEIGLKRAGDLKLARALDKLWLAPKGIA